MSYLVISFSHKNLDIKQREKLAFNSDEEKARFIKKVNEEKREIVNEEKDPPCCEKGSGKLMRGKLKRGK